MARKWSLLIVDDEPRARALIRKMLRNAKDFEVARECSNGYEAIEAVKTLHPDLMLLDVQMPEIDGFAVLKELRDETLPEIVFVTAFDQYAIRAFEVHALDYLLKPFDEDRFLVTLSRVKGHLLQRDLSDGNEKILSLLQQMKKLPEFLDRFAVRSGGRIILVSVDDVEWIEAEDKYVRLHTAAGSHLVRDTLSRIEEVLNPK
ncbi:MAG: LytR/AlgR family response regulator transcription factor, partial [Blastocatellia bacterium]